MFNAQAKKKICVFKILFASHICAVLYCSHGPHAATERLRVGVACLNNSALVNGAEEFYHNELNLFLFSP